MKNRGISIIEVLVSIAIIGGSIAVFATLLNILQLNKSGGLNFSAYKLAQEELEAVRSLPLSDLTVRANDNFANVFYNSGAAGAISDGTAISLPNSFELSNSTSSLAAVLLPYNKMADLTVEANLNSTSTAQKTGIVFRGRDNENYYFFYIKNDRIGLEKNVNGSITSLHETLQSFSSNAWYKIKAVAGGTSLSLYLNDNLFATVVDSSLGSGYAALASYSSSSRFDNVSLTYNSQISSWNFDDLSANAVPADWQRFGINDLPNGQGFLTISEPYGVSTIKKIDVSVNWTERGEVKTVSLSTMVK